MTQDKNNESNVAESELRYRRLFETAQDGILIIDFDSGYIKDANPFITNLLGYSREELIDQELWEIGFMIDKTLALKAFTTIQEKGYVRYENLPLRHKNGDIREVEFVSNAYHVGGHKVIQCNIRDITERKKLEEENLKFQHLMSVSLHQMIETLANVIVARDSYTAGHQKRVANLASAIAAKLNLPLHTIEGIELSALIHDIGKIAVPAEILTKPSKLSSFELAMLRNHVQTGYDILKNMNFPWNLAQIILEHHERVDGSGYPNGLKGDSICEEARIIAVADTVEAISSDRPYRKSKGIEAALEEITMNRGILYDDRVVDACLDVFKEDHFEFPDI
ncbi:HD domain-containing phosphohydrolase [Candidatus Methylopumilus rimovensis]|uniref:PAS domain S-box protein n=1 Tax=Candidatus Methylopumilus rimovensis TaxID=2588535 RepID=A0AAE6FTS6_9PROT|nr:HD domain-containing phosphohydrolase [Candidatus Methylopumilus rimovensis]QDD12755.1 PAS domain S-box protein [Candidatus Methylopumilus rimovensis]QDD14060.1 PAS domain S-box protein [Candidatus Methylopumilus rimovensis]